MAHHSVSVVVVMTDEEFELLSTYQGQFMRDVPETVDEKQEAIQVFVQELVENWIDYQTDPEDDDEDDEGFDEVGELTVQ